MELTTSRVVRLLAVSALTALSHFGTPSAHAVSPPEVDDRWLPKPALPAPPRPTVQREVCTTIAADPVPGGDQRANLDLPRVWQLTRGAGQRVAVIDTGVSRHRRLPDVVPGGDYVFTGDGTQDCDAHGTLVAGIIASSPALVRHLPQDANYFAQGGGGAVRGRPASSPTQAWADQRQPMSPSA